jgi:parallel beta-helix repeat protein
MGSKETRLRLPALVSVIAAAALVAAGSAAASGQQANKVYVSPTGSASSRDNSCARAGFSSIQAAIEAAPPDGTVVVCAGTYPGMVTVDRLVTLQGRMGATIDATGDSYGVGISASSVKVTGLTVENASPLDPDNGQLADGIVTFGVGPGGPVAANDVRIVGNVVTGNLGSGIDLNSTSGSFATGNTANGNGVGINVADDLGLPASGNRIAQNVADENFGGCGIALADHTGAGVTDNVVFQNRANNNGLSTATAPDASAGSGVILASPVPDGIVTGNTITQNRFWGNGHAGVVVHAHAPGADFSGNIISHNSIGQNNLRTDENDLQTTGIYLGSLSAQTITLNGNTIRNDYYGVFTSGPVTVKGAPNQFAHVTQPFGSAPSF